MLSIFFYAFLFFTPNIVITCDTKKFPSYAAVTSGEQKAPGNGFSKTMVEQQQKPISLPSEQHHPYVIWHLLTGARHTIESLPEKITSKSKRNIRKTIELLQPLAEMNQSPSFWGWHPAWTSQAEAWKLIGQLEKINGDSKSAIQSYLNALFIAHNNTHHAPDDGYDHYPVDVEVVTSLTHLINTKDNLKYIPDLLHQAHLKTEIEQQQYLIPLYTYAHKLGNQDGTYLLAKHKQQCGTIKSLKKAEQLFSDLVQAKNKNAFVDLLVTQHALISKFKESNKQPKADKKKAEFLLMAEQTVKTRKQFEVVIAKFEQTDNQQAIYDLAEHMFRKVDTKRKDNFRFKAAFEVAKREQDTAKSDIYLGIAIHQIAEAQTYAFELYKKTHDPQRSMSLLKMVADSGHQEASYLYGCSLKEKYISAEVIDRNLILQAQKYLKYAAEHQDANLEAKLEYAITAPHHEDAIKRLKALGNEPCAHFHLGDTYKQYAKHTTKPRMQKLYQQRALEYYKKAADTGHTESAIKLAALHIEVAQTETKNHKKEKHFKQAELLIEETLCNDNITPHQRSNTLCCLSNLYLHHNNMYDAIASYLQAYEIDPSNDSVPKSLYKVITTLKKLKQYEWTIYAYEQMIAIENNNIEKISARQRSNTLCNLGKMYLCQDNMHDAVTSLIEACKTDQSNYAACKTLYMVLDQLKNRKSYELMIYTCEKMLEINNQCHETHMALGVAYLGKKNPQKAIEHFNQSEKLGSHQAAYNLGLLFSRDKTVKKNLDKAIEHLQRALEMNPNFVKALNLLGNVHQERNERKIARSYFMRSAIQGSGEGNFAMGQCYQKGIGGALNLTRALSYYEAAHHNFALNQREIDQVITRINMKLCFYLNANHLNRYKPTEIPEQFKKLETELSNMLIDRRISSELHNEIYLALAIQNGFMASHIHDEAKEMEDKSKAIKAELSDLLNNKTVPSEQLITHIQDKAKEMEDKSKALKAKVIEHRDRAFIELNKVLVATKRINSDSIRGLYHLSNIIIKLIMNYSNDSLTTEQEKDLRQARTYLEKITDLNEMPPHFKDEGILDLAINDLATVYERFFNDNKKCMKILEKGAQRGSTICCINLAKQYENEDLQKTKKLLENAVAYGGFGADDAYKHLIVIKFYLKEKIDVPVEKMFLKDYLKKSTPIIQEKTKRFEQSKSWNNLTSEQRAQLTRLTFEERKSIFASLDLSIE